MHIHPPEPSASSSDLRRYNTHTLSRRVRVALLSAALLSSAAGGLLFTYETQARGNSPPTHTATSSGVTTPRQLDQNSPFGFANLVQSVAPAVVTVLVEHNGAAHLAGDMTNQVPAPFRNFRQFGQGQGRERQPQTSPSLARGSGFIIDGNGYIVTNNHVVDGGDKILVKLSDGREFQAKVIGTDKETDVALLKVDEVKDLPSVSFGDDRGLRVGDWLVAVGNPFGLGGSVTAGIVSSIHRNIGDGPLTDYIQLDASINQGNSGGPSFDMSGRVMGMNTAIFSTSGGSVGIGFAIPASTVKWVVEQLKDHGNVERGWLGVQIQSLTPEMAASIGTVNAKGAIVASVVDNSPAAKAGLKQGDVIVSLNGNGVDDSRDLTRKVSEMGAGQQAEFGVIRDGQSRKVTTLIGKRDGERVASGESTGPGAKQASENVLGMGLAPLNRDARQQFGLRDDTSGVVVTAVDPNSDASEKGLHSGDVIVRAGEKGVNMPSDVVQSVEQAKRLGRTNVLLLVDGIDGQHFVALKIT